MSLINDALKKQIAELRADGASDADIVAFISTEKIENALKNVTEQMAADTSQYIENTMYERVLSERARESEFVAHNEQIWSKGFVMSEAMYLITLDAAEEYNQYISELPPEEIENKQYRYLALRQLHARSCQVYLEILTLIKAGFADGAYARWRSLYELSVIAEFIGKNGEEVAKAYYEESFSTEAKQNDWAKVAPCFSNSEGKSKRGHITFDQIQQQCIVATETWKKQYKLSNKIVHATPHGTFGRIGAPDAMAITPVGRSDYGLAMPAVNSAISLLCVSTDFFNTIPSGDSIAYTKTLEKWVELIQTCYKDIEKTCFHNTKD